MNVDAIRAGAGAMANGALSRVDLVDSPPERFDHDFATKMVNDHQAAIDQTQKAQTLARGTGDGGDAAGSIAPPLLQQQAGAMALVAALPAPPPPACCSSRSAARASAGRTPASTRRPGVAP